MKKLGLLVIPLMTISFLASCNNGGGDDPGPTPKGDVEFSVTDSTVDYDDYTHSAVVELKWKPASDSITFSNLNFTYETKYAENVTAEATTSSPANIYIKFGEAGLEEDVTGTLSFAYSDSTTGVTGEDEIKNITIDVDEPEPPVTEYSISMKTEGTTISPTTMDVGEPYSGTITVTNNTKILDGDESLKSVKLKTSEEDITSYCTDYNPSADYKSATFTIPAEYITDDIEVEVTLIDKPKTGVVIWYDEDGTTPLKVDEAVPVGYNPHYEGKTPYKPKDANNIYRFSGWNPDPTTYVVEEGANSFKAKYDPVSLTELKAEMEIVIPEASEGLTFGFTYDATKEITVDWGDETVDSEASHTYEKGGSYNISVCGEDITSIDAGFTKSHASRAYLTQIQLQEGITTINDFVNCVNLTSVSVPSSIISVENEAFTGCDKLVYEIYDKCNYLGNNTNKYQVVMGPCEKTITGTSLHEKCTVIKDYGFSFAKLASITIPDGVVSIPMNAFYATQLTSITIPDNVTSIGEFAFNSCPELKSVNINSSSKLENIEMGAFGSCTALETVVIPPSVKIIKQRAFSNVRSLKEVDLTGFDIKEYDHKALPILEDDNFTHYPDGVVFYVKNDWMAALFASDDIHGWDKIDGSLYKAKTFG